MDPDDLETLEALLDERLGGVPLTPGERAEALCIALGVGCELSAAARGVSAGAVRASRRRLLRKIERALAHEPASLLGALPAAARLRQGLGAACTRGRGATE